MVRLAAVVVLGLTAVVHAEPPGLAPLAAPAQPTEPPLPADFTESYRGQIIASDAIAVGLTLVAAISATSGSRAGTSLFELGVTTYLIGPPMIHLLHDRGVNAIGSLGLRVLLPIITGFVGSIVGKRSCTSDYCGDNEEIAGAAIGLAAGLISASAIDAAVFAREDERPMALRLTALPIRGGLGLGLSRSF